MTTTPTIANITINGTIHTIQMDSFEIVNDVISLTGAIIPNNKDIKEVEAPETKNRPPLRNYLFKSALIKFQYDGMLTTGAITHCTDKAWRVVNLQYGATWIPKNIIHWSEISQQFCVVDSEYQFNFTQSVTREMSEYPHVFNPETLVIEELNY